jgi:hypothetical protein
LSYAKLYSSITESSLWSEPKDVRLLFVSMLARADATGFVEASVPGLARMANLTIEEAEIALETLEGPDRHSKNPEHDGRRILKVPGGWTLLNYEAYRNRRSDDERREYMRNYMQEYRTRKPAVNNSANGKHDVNHGKAPLAQAEAEAEVDTMSPDGDAAGSKPSKAGTEYPAEFERFWSAYPKRDGRRNGKGATLKLWKKLAGPDRELVIRAAINFCGSQLARDNKARDPERFLKDAWWRDWIHSTATSPTPQPAAEVPHRIPKASFS